MRDALCLMEEPECHIAALDFAIPARAGGRECWLRMARRLFDQLEAKYGQKETCCALDHRPGLAAGKNFLLSLL